MEKKLVTAETVAEMLAVSVSRVYVLSKSVFPKGVTIQLGRRLRFDLEALNTWLENGGAGLESGRR